MKLVQQRHYNSDGSVTEEFRKYLKETGTSDETIALYEKLQRDEIEDERLFGPTPEEKIARAKNRLIGRSGLNTQELLSEGYLSVDDLDDDFPEDLL